MYFPYDDYINKWCCWLLLWSCLLVIENFKPSFCNFTETGPHSGYSLKRFRTFLADWFLHNSSRRLLLQLETSLYSFLTHLYMVEDIENPENQFFCCRKWWPCKRKWFCRKQPATSHKIMNLILHPHLMYYIHNWFTQYVIFTQHWRKRSKQNRSAGG